MIYHDPEISILCNFLFESSSSLTCCFRYVVHWLCETDWFWCAGIVWCWIGPEFCIISFSFQLQAYSQFIMTPDTSSAVNVVSCALHHLGHSDRSQISRIRNILCYTSNVGGSLDVRTIDDSSNHSHPCESGFTMMSFDQLLMPANSSILFSCIRPHRPTPTQVLCMPCCISLTHHSVCAYNYSTTQPIRSHVPRYVQLFIKSIRNTTISILIDSISSISDLKHFIYVHDGIPPCDLRLMHRGCELRDDALLSGLDVDGATMTCLLRVRGGRPRTHKIPLRWDRKSVV